MNSPDCPDKSWGKPSLSTSHPTIDLMLNKMSPFHHKCTETAQACKTH